jgi:hypothetical protein
MDLPSLSWVYGFISKHEEIKLLRPVQLCYARIRACLRPNIESWIDKIHNLIKEKNYEKDLIFQVDETSCLVHSHHPAKRVVSSTVGYLPLLSLSPILHMTCVFGVNALGGHLRTQILLPESYHLPPELCERYPELKITPGKSGWMEKGIWEKYIHGIIFPEVERVRGILGNQKAPDLLVVDGHSSRLNRGLWLECAEKNIDVMVLPSHTSHILQPLDLSSNGVFKRALEKAPPFPARRQLESQIGHFLLQLRNAIYQALSPSTIIKGFEEAAIIGGAKETVLLKCEASLPCGIPPAKESNRFSISGELVTDPLFLEKWQKFDSENERRREEKKRKQEERKKREEIGKERLLSDGVLGDVEEKSGKKETELEEEDEMEKEVGEEKVLLIRVEEEREDEGKDEEAGYDEDENSLEKSEDEEEDWAELAEDDWREPENDFGKRRRHKLPSWFLSHEFLFPKRLKPSPSLEIVEKEKGDSRESLDPLDSECRLQEFPIDYLPLTASCILKHPKEVVLSGGEKEKTEKAKTDYPKEFKQTGKDSSSKVVESEARPIHERRHAGLPQRYMWDE